ncbi:hypothetical protein E4U46_005759 [Claviceps purpurea]|nr:hypothetical protein E4U46_005759 [Claviceps purpurea]
MAIRDLLSALSWQQMTALACGVWILYAIVVAVQRLYLSPIAHIPGPRLAALTQYYEFYYDIILGGKYTFKILELHKQYGPVVRISPWEVHVGEPDFQDDLYGGPTRPRDKWQFWAKQMSLTLSSLDSALATISHDHHRIRRSAINPFFSTQSVRNLQAVIEERVDSLLEALYKVAASRDRQPLDFLYPFSAFTNDVINEYAFARSDHLIERPDFGAEVTDNLLMGTHLGPLVKHANWALKLINALPESFSGRWIPGWSGFLKMKNDIVDQIAMIKATENTEKWQLDVDHTTIFHELLSSDALPDREKTPARLAQEGQILVQGGTLTTSWTLTLATFHLLHRPSTLKRLRDELFEAIPDPNEVVPLAKLESLPFLRAVVKEALRHGIGTSGRLSRIARDEAHVVHDEQSMKDWHIPPNTVVSMSPYKTIMDETIFPDPMGFRPERWLKDGERLEKYLAVFGGGTRSCLGMALANAELHLALAKLFRRWGSGGAFEGDFDEDRREGDVGVLRIFDTTTRDCQMASDYFIPIPYKGSKGVRFMLDLV